MSNDSKHFWQGLGRLGMLILVLEIGSASSALAGEALFYKEANLVGGYTDREQWVANSQTLKTSLGFEYFKKFSNDYGDFLTLDLQARTFYDASQRGDQAWGVEIHDAWLEYKLGLGKNMRIGHFAPAFGLEPSVDTHGTLLQTLAPRNIGFKKDWGVSSRGFWGPVDYEIAAQMGSGMGIRKPGENFLLTARVGSPAGQPFRYGVSLLWGEVLKSKQMRTIPHPELVSGKGAPKKRVGFDAQYETGPYTFKSEVAFGQDRDNEVLGMLAQVDYVVPKFEKLQIEIQGNSFFHDLSEGQRTDAQIVTGFSYAISPKVTFRLGYFGDMHSSRDEEDHQILFQLYYFAL